MSCDLNEVPCAFSKPGLRLVLRLVSRHERREFLKCFASPSEQFDDRLDLTATPQPCPLELRFLRGLDIGDCLLRPEDATPFRQLARVSEDGYLEGVADEEPKVLLFRLRDGLL